MLKRISEFRAHRDRTDGVPDLHCYSLSANLDYRRLKCWGMLDYRMQVMQRGSRGGRFAGRTALWKACSRQEVSAERDMWARGGIYVE